DLLRRFGSWRQIEVSRRNARRLAHRARCVPCGRHPELFPTVGVEQITFQLATLDNSFFPYRQTFTVERARAQRARNRAVIDYREKLGADFRSELADQKGCSLIQSIARQSGGEITKQ